MVVSKGFYSADVVEKKLKGVEPDDMIPGTLLDNYLVMKGASCTAYMVRFLTTQSSCYEIMEGPEKEIRAMWDELKKKTENTMNEKET